MYRRYMHIHNSASPSLQCPTTAEKRLHDATAVRMQGVACSLGTLLRVARGEAAATHAAAAARVQASLQRYGKAFDAWHRVRLELAAADASAAAADASQRVWQAAGGGGYTPRDVKQGIASGALQVQGWLHHE